MGGAGILGASSALIAMFAEKSCASVSRRLQALVAGCPGFVRVEARVAEADDWGRDTFSVKFWHFWRALVSAPVFFVLFEEWES